MRKLTVLFTILTFIFSFQLQAQKPDAKYFDNLAEDICSCIQPLMDAADLMEKYEASGETDKLEVVAEQLDKDLVEMEGCLTKLEKKYPEMDKKEEYGEMAMESLKKICPAFHTILLAEEEAINELQNEKLEVVDEEYYVNAANEFCDCTARLFEVAEELEKAKEKGKKKKIKALEKEMEKELNSITECAVKINEKYPDVELNDENKTRFGNALAKHCDRFVK